MRLTAKQVEAFHRVYIAGSITAASEHLHLSQPAVSRLVADLERALGIMLFERRNRRLFPTPEGRMMFDEIERSFIGLEKISSRAEEIRSLRSGSVRIAAMPALSLSILPTVIKQFTSTHPGVHVLLNTSLSESVFDWIGSDRMDIGLAALPANKTVAQIELLPCPPCLCVLPAGSAYANRDVIMPEDLADMPFVSLMANSMLRRRIDAVFQAAGVQRQMVLETPYSLSAMQFAKLGLGVTIVDPFSARLLVDGSVVVKPFIPEIPYEFGLVYPGAASLSLVAQRFVDTLRGAIRSL
ncbi:LysR substrate-binding domain-containing protein [Mesorhizobium sp. L-8-3]|uniref:LysR substrate-binding domain-containing protein n=1 Tax=Mesorhizobium sp. L-8-3 TaxID=2744522 RepID=UPI001925B5B6|nr:LysR substrate-binding domain-containing protein [Mesorhizobium sp. L-8-3]BCH27887.1 transcriptional regulator [Mesorhizobium sp. L-8-3]